VAAENAAPASDTP